MLANLKHNNRFGMGTLRRFFEALDTPGGHIVVLLLVLLWFACNPTLEKFMAEIVGALLMILRGGVAGQNNNNNNNKEDKNTHE